MKTCKHCKCQLMRHPHIPTWTDYETVNMPLGWVCTDNPNGIQHETEEKDETEQTSHS